MHVAGWGATLISQFAMEGFEWKSLPRAVSLPDHLLIPYTPELEDAIVPSAERIADEVRAAFDVVVGVDSYSYHRLLGELRRGEPDPGWRLADGGPAVIAEARRAGAEAVSLETCFLDGPRVRGRARGRLLVGRAERPRVRRVGGRARRSARVDRDAARRERRSCGSSSPDPRCAAASRSTSRSSAPCVRSQAAAEAARAAGIAARDREPRRPHRRRARSGCSTESTSGCCFDTANALRVGDDVLEATALLAARIEMVHLKDVEPLTPRHGPGRRSALRPVRHRCRPGRGGARHARASTVSCASSSASSDQATTSGRWSRPPSAGCARTASACRCERDSLRARRRVHALRRDDLHEAARRWTSRTTS